MLTRESRSPFVSFDSITSNGSRLLNIQGFDEFQRDFAAKAVPQFCFMSPNMMHDGHNTTLDVATSWAHTFLKPVLDGGAFDEKTLIMLTYDESEDYKKPNHIVTLLLGERHTGRSARLGRRHVLRPLLDPGHGRAQLGPSQPGPLRRRRERVRLPGQQPAGLPQQGAGRRRQRRQLGVVPRRP